MGQFRQEYIGRDANAIASAKVNANANAVTNVNVNNYDNWKTLYWILLSAD